MHGTICLSRVFGVLLFFSTIALVSGAADTTAPTAEGFSFTDLVALVGAVVIIARIVVKLTPSPKDDTIFAKVVEWLKHLGLVVK